MLTLYPGQLELTAEAIFLNKLEGQLRQQIPEFNQLSEAERAQFLVAGLRKAQALGFVSELGFGAYILNAWWLGIGFETQSQSLQRILASPIPEIRKIHVLNEYARVLVGAPDRPDLAEQVLQQELERSAPFKN